MPKASNDLDKLENLIRQNEGSNAALTDVFEAFGQFRENLDRWKIARLVVWLYVLTIGVIVLYLVLRYWFSGEDVYPQLSDTMKVSVVPVLTFVLGYYYGTARR